MTYLEDHTVNTRNVNLLNIENHESVTPSTYTLVETFFVIIENIDIYYRLQVIFREQEKIRNYKE